MSDPGAKNHRPAAKNSGFADLYDLAKSDSERNKPATANPEQLKLVLEKGYRDGYDRGVKDGNQYGLNMAMETLEVQRRALIHLAETFKSTLDEHSEDFANEVVGLALDIAKAMTKKHFQIDRQAIIPVVREAIEALPLVKKPLQLFVNPQDAQLVTKLIEKEFSDIGWSVVERPEIDRGGCMIESQFNTVDANNAVRWKHIAQALGHTNLWHETEQA
jgi:flagellar assembly protein FliH